MTEQIQAKAEEPTNPTTDPIRTNTSTEPKESEEMSLPDRNEEISVKQEQIGNMKNALRERGINVDEVSEELIYDLTEQIQGGNLNNEQTAQMFLNLEEIKKQRSLTDEDAVNICLEAIKLFSSDQPEDKIIEYFEIIAKEKGIEYLHSFKLFVCTLGEVLGDEDLVKKYDEILDKILEKNSEANLNAVAGNVNIREIQVYMDSADVNDQADKIAEQAQFLLNSNNEDIKTYTEELKKYVDEYVQAAIRKEEEKKKEKEEQNSETDQEKREKVVTDILELLNTDDPRIRYLVNQWIVQGPYKSAFEVVTSSSVGYAIERAKNS